MSPSFRHLSLASIILAAAGLLALSACEETAAGGPLASQAAVEECRGDCTKMKFFGCIGGDTHEQCFNACGQATEAQAALFESCGVGACDPACLEHLPGFAPVADPDPGQQGPGPVGEGGGGEGSGSEGGGSEGGGSEGGGSEGGEGGWDKPPAADLETCKDTCDYRGANCFATPQETLECHEACDLFPEVVTQSFVQCVANQGCTNGCQMGVNEYGCRDACDKLESFGCITFDDIFACNDLCDARSLVDRTTFHECAYASQCDAGCFYTFAGGE